MSKIEGTKQTDFTPGKGNALQACIATALGLSLEQVPNFIDLPGDFYTHLRRFLAERGLGFMKIVLEENEIFKMPFDPGQAVCLIAGKSPRGSHKHICVGKIEDGVPIMLFDPHPDDTFIEGNPVWIGMFVSLDPADFLIKNKEE